MTQLEMKMGHRKTHYLWQLASWPQFSWDSTALQPLLGQARRIQGELVAQADLMDLKDQSSFSEEEVFTTSAIEGETLNRESIRSSVAKRLGLSTAGLPPSTRNIDGLVEVLFDATRLDVKFNQIRLNQWHAALFPTGYSGFHAIEVGRFRKEPMQVVSGAIGREKIHFEAPPVGVLKEEMKRFFEWWRNPSQDLDGILRAGVAHLWFVTVHPYDDGNGRLARAITDMALAQDERTQRRLYSLSSQIYKDRSRYYQILESTQKSGGDITEWLQWFLQIYIRAVNASLEVVQRALGVERFWKKHRQSELNARQLKVIQRLIESGPSGFEGGMNNRKYVGLTKTSRESAKRDLADLEEKGILRRQGQGRSVSYVLILSE